MVAQAEGPGVCCPGFQIWGMYKPLPGCRNKRPCSSRWGLLMGMLLCPAPHQGLHPGFSVGSGGEGGPKTRPCPELLWKVPLPSLHQRAENSTACPRLSPSQRPWEDGAAAVARVSWVAGSRQAAPTLPASEAGEHPARPGQHGQHPPRRVEGAEQMSVAQGWHPGSCRSRHSFLILLQP